MEDCTSGRLRPFDVERTLPHFSSTPGNCEHQQQPVLYRPENVALRTFQVEGQLSNEGAQVDDHALRTWAARFLQRFPQILSRFPAVYLAVFDPHMRLSADLPGSRLVATLPEHRLYELDR
ncbi:hypothetical protein [Paraburkholderia sp. SIMBA_030]|uniref:hypothetical protein n=1 Tax=Paraburkholderia sp. SIMBA_030 TaxID=3085773 RepID=UPI00397ACC47